MSEARGRVHARICKGSCIAYGDTPSDLCRSVDRLLDRVEQDALHMAALDFEARMDAQGWPRGIGPGVSYMVREMDPFEKIDAFDPDLHDVHPSEFSDCPQCAGGVEHWHHKGTQDPVL
jgi:hypothetical protein